jgi:hypothetical protein
MFGENIDRMARFGTLLFLKPGKFVVAQNSLTTASFLEAISSCKRQNETDELVLLIGFISFFTVNFMLHGSNQHHP